MPENAQFRSKMANLDFKNGDFDRKVANFDKKFAFSRLECENLFLFGKVIGTVVLECHRGGYQRVHH